MHHHLLAKRLDDTHIHTLHKLFIILSISAKSNPYAAVPTLLWEHVILEHLYAEKDGVCFWRGETGGWL